MLLLVGDTAGSEGEALERCLSFTFTGQKLFVAGNHELWTAGDDSYRVFTEELPRRVRALGWQWLEGEPAVFGDVGIVGTVGWYDYAFARPEPGSRGGSTRRKFHPERPSGSPSSLRCSTEPTTSRQPRERSTHAGTTAGSSNSLAAMSSFSVSGSTSCTAHSRPSGPASACSSASHHVPFEQLLPPRPSAAGISRGRTWAVQRSVKSFSSSPTSRTSSAGTAISR